VYRRLGPIRLLAIATGVYAMKYLIERSPKTPDPSVRGTGAYL
jgi:hypothetical protein